MTDTPENLVQTNRRKARKKHHPEEKIRIFLEGLRGEESIAELCRREGITKSQYCSWSTTCTCLGLITTMSTAGPSTRGLRVKTPSSPSPPARKVTVTSGSHSEKALLPLWINPLSW